MKTPSRTLLNHSCRWACWRCWPAAWSAVRADSGKGAAAGDLTIGFIYVGPKDDYGYNQAHAEGAAAVKKMDGRQGPGGGKGPGNGRCAEDHEEHDRGRRRQADLPDLLRLLRPARRRRGQGIPERHCSSTAAACGTKTSTPTNLGTYFGYIDEPEYLSGIVAAYATKSKKLGFIAAKPIPQVRRNINAFTLGRPQRRSVDHLLGHFHGRLVDAGQGVGGRDEPDRSGRGRPDLPRGQPQGGYRDGGAPRHPLHRLPHQPGGARAQRLPDRRRVELGEGLHRLCERHQNRQEIPEPAPRRPQGADRQDVALRQGRQRRGEEEGGRGQGQVHGRVRS